MILDNLTFWAGGDASRFAAFHQQMLEAAMGRVRIRNQPPARAARLQTYVMVSHISLRWQPPCRVSDFKLCREEACTVSADRPARAAYSVTSSEPIRRDEWVRVLQPISPQFNVSVGAARTSPPFSLPAPGGIPSLWFKPLMWEIRGQLVKSAQSKRRSFLRHADFTALLPAVLPTGHLDGAFVLVDACRPAGIPLGAVQQFFCTSRASA